MARETIRRAVVQKFNEEKGWELEDFEALKDKIDIGKDGRKEVNRIINSLKICDPAVGSGHFLVSALNEMIALKSELRVLGYRDGSRMKLYSARVENDELIVEDDDEGAIFEYGLSKQGTIIPEKQAVQEAIFHEKQTIIENCLFGVDINPNSVKICRLRLWIELLKHAYYTPARTPRPPEGGVPPATPYPPEGGTPPATSSEGGTDNLELQTLPNIDINIKAGNSLISRFPLDASLASALKRSSWKIGDYRKFVQDYKNAENKDEKHGLQAVIDQIKKDFRTEITRDDPKQKRLNKLVSELHDKYTGNKLFEDQLTKKQKQDRARLEKKINKLQTEIDDMKNNEIYRNAFEWRFEFPEVLDDEGNFMGFDVVIGNPPYIRQEELKNLKELFKYKYKVYTSSADILVYFIEKGIQILNKDGYLNFITSNKFLRATYGKPIRTWLKKYQLHEILDFGDLPVFEEASTYPMILLIQNHKNEDELKVTQVDTLNFDNLHNYKLYNQRKVSTESLQKQSWNLIDEQTYNLFKKIDKKGINLEKYTNAKIFRGILTGLNEAFVIDENTKSKLIIENSNNKNLIKPFLAGKDIKRYKRPNNDKFLIFFPKGWTKANYGNLTEEEAFHQLKKDYPGIAEYLKQFNIKARNRYDKGEYWWELRACDYYKEFEKPKIILPDISLRGNFTLDEEGKYYIVNTAYMIGSSEKFLLGILASKLIDFYYRNISSSYRGGYLRFIYQYLAQIPIVQASNNQKNKIENKVDQILQQKQHSPSVATSTLEAEIDEMVYDLYGLTEEEREIVEEAHAHP
jgi:type II restriction/modification system DNA methylase subunit YeeA